MYRLAAVLILLVPSFASADIAPSDQVETCTLESISRERSGCEACRASFQDPDGCTTQHASDGLERACRSGGASVWTEVWCSPAGATPAVPSPAPAPAPSPAPAPAPAAQTSSGCAVTHATSSVPTLLFAAIAIAAAARRARRSRR